MTGPELVVDARAQAGESPWWCARSQSLFWVDIHGRALHRFVPATGEATRYPAPDLVAFVATHSDGGLVIALRDRVVHADRGMHKLTLLARPPLPDGARLNDGAIDAQGRLWIGALDGSGAARAALYRIDRDGTCTAVLEGFRSTNGLAFAPDGRTLYVSDSHPAVRTVWALDYDVRTGASTRRRVFVDTRTLAGRPDGGCTDAQGCYWMAAVDGGCLLRFDAAGRPLATFPLPVEKPSKAAFAGPELRDLYVTSLRRNLGAPESQPHAGGLFRLRPGVEGWSLPDCAIDVDGAARKARS